MFVFIATMLFGCYREDIRTFEIHVPQMNNENCAQRVRAAFFVGGGQFKEGILDLELNVAERTVTVTYNSTLTARKNLEYLLTHAGFDANDEKARPEAQANLPAECRP